jgi:hypothetical protein
MSVQEEDTIAFVDALKIWLNHQNKLKQADKSMPMSHLFDADLEWKFISLLSAQWFKWI